MAHMLLLDVIGLSHVMILIIIITWGNLVMLNSLCVFRSMSCSPILMKEKIVTLFGLSY